MSKSPFTSADHRSARLAIIATARKMVAGQIDLLDGCRTILSYRRQLGDHADALFLVLEGVESETDDLPGAATRELWDADALRRKEREKEEYLHRAKGPLLDACRAIITALSD